jgi:hypothetical protein
MAAGVASVPGLRVVAPPEATLLAIADDGGPDDPDIRVVADELTARGWLVGVQPEHDGPANLHVSLSAVLEPRVDAFLADLAAAAAAARTLGRAVPDPALVAAAATLDPATLTDEMVDGLLALAGLRAPGGGLPARMAPVHALLDAAPPALVERLFTEVVSRVYTSA